MKYSWMKNIYDEDGDIFEDCILVFAGETILKFKDPQELENFAMEITNSLEEICNNS